MRLVLRGLFASNKLFLTFFLYLFYDIILVDMKIYLIIVDIEIYTSQLATGCQSMCQH